MPVLTSNRFRPLRTVARMAAGAVDLDQLLQSIANAVSDEFECSLGAIYLYDEDEDALTLCAVGQTGEVHAGAYQLPRGRSFLWRALETMQVMRAESAAELPQPHPAEVHVAVPLGSTTAPIGVVWLGSADATYFTEDEQLLALGDLVALVISNARLNADTHARAEREAVINQLNRAIYSTLELDEILRMAVLLIGRHLDADECAIFDLPADSATLHRRYQYRNPNLADVAARPPVDALELPSGGPELRAAAAAGEIVAAYATLPSDDKPDQLPAIARQFGARAVLLAPIPGLGKGNLSLLSVSQMMHTRYWREDELMFLQSMTAQLAIATQNAALFAAERRRRQEADTLREVTGALNTSLETERVLELILEQLARVVDYDNASVMLLLNGAIKIVAGRGRRADDKHQPPLRAEHLAHLQEVLELHRPVIIPDITADARWQRFPRAEHIRCWMGVPLVANDQVIGMLNLTKNEPGFYTAGDAELTTAFANQAAAAIDNANLFAALRESETRYRSLFDGVPIGLYRTTPEGSFLDANPALVELFGFPDRETLLAGNVAQLFDDPEERNRWQAEIERVGVVHHREAKLRRRDGTRIWVQDTGRVVHDADGQVSHYEGSLEDITARRQAEIAITRRAQEMVVLYETSLQINAEPHLTTLFNTIVRQAATLLRAGKGGLLLVQPDGETLKVVAVHNQPEDGLGVTLRMGEGLAGRIAQSGQPLMIPDYERWEGRMPGLITRPIGRILGVPLKQGKQIIGVLNVFDGERTGAFDDDEVRILSLFAAQAGIAIHNAQLHAELQQTAAQLQDANADLQAFVYTASHDLQAPIVSLRGFANLLTQRYADTLDERGQQYLDRIAVNAQVLNELLQDLLELSRVGRMEEPDEQVDIANVVRLVMTQQAQALEAAGIQTRVANHWPTVIYSHRRLLQVLGNLVSNAAKFMGARDDPCIEVDWREEEDCYALSVRDNGIGIAPEHQTHIFEPFYRVRALPVEGHGVGLNIVKRIVEHRGGQISVQSEPGGGSAFTFTIPKM